MTGKMKGGKLTNWNALFNRFCVCFLLSGTRGAVPPADSGVRSQYALLYVRLCRFQIEAGHPSEVQPHLRAFQRLLYLLSLHAMHGVPGGVRNVSFLHSLSLSLSLSRIRSKK